MAIFGSTRYWPKAEYPPGTTLRATFYGRQVEITNVGGLWDIRWESPAIARITQDHAPRQADSSGDLVLPSTLGLFKGVWQGDLEGYFGYGVDEFADATLHEGTLNTEGLPVPGPEGRVVIELPDVFSLREVQGEVWIVTPVRPIAVDVGTEWVEDGSLAHYRGIRTRYETEDVEEPFYSTSVPIHKTPRMVGTSLVLDLYLPEDTPLQAVSVSLDYQPYRRGDFVVHNNALWVRLNPGQDAIEPGGAYDDGYWMSVLTPGE